MQLPPFDHATPQRPRENRGHVRGLVRIYDVRMVQIVLKIEKNCPISWVRVDRKTYGLRPRLWLLVQHKLTFDLTGKITVVFLKTSVTIPCLNRSMQKSIDKMQIL